MLGNRQLAMLREMGVRIWQPTPLPTALKTAANSPLAKPVPVQANAANAINTVAARARIHSATGQNDTKIMPSATAGAPGVAVTNAWVTGPAAQLYATSDLPTHGRWLVLLESSSGAGPQGGFDPLWGEGGKLLDNMLRAAKLHTTGGVTVMPLMRDSGQAASTALKDSLPEMVATLQPAVIFIMGRLAAQAVLQSSEPLAKLRGRVHQVHGTPTIVSMEPVYLLRNLPDKAKAWEDMCLALSVANFKGV